MTTDINKVALPTGRVISLDEVQFSPDTNRFYIGNFDVTDYMSEEQMMEFDGFDVDTFLDKKYQQNYANQHGGAAPPPVGSTSIASNFVTGFTVPEPIANTLKALPGYIMHLAIVILIGVGLYLAFDVWMTFKPKKS